MIHHVFQITTAFAFAVVDALNPLDPMLGVLIAIRALLYHLLCHTAPNPSYLCILVFCTFRHPLRVLTDYVCMTSYSLPDIFKRLFEIHSCVVAVLLDATLAVLHIHFVRHVFAVLCGFKKIHAYLFRATWGFMVFFHSCI